MKKLMVGLAPLLAVAAFMVVPTMASANEWYSNGVKVKGEAKAVEVLTAGELTLHDTVLGIEVTCKVVDRGKVWNAAGAGKDSITAFVNYNCTAPAPLAPCKVTAKNLPWSSVLVGSRDEIKGISVDVECAGGGQVYTGTLSPDIVNGSQTATSFEASFAEFAENEATGNLVGEISGTPGFVRGDDYLVGEEGQLITTA